MDKYQAGLILYLSKEVRNHLQEVDRLLHLFSPEMCKEVMPLIMKAVGQASKRGECPHKMLLLEAWRLCLHSILDEANAKQEEADREQDEANEEAASDEQYFQ